MKKIAFATVAVSMLLTGAASAADLGARPYYSKAPAPILAAYNWSGFYIGVNGGGGWADKCWDIYNNVGAVVAPAFREGCHTASGGTIGGQVGYRWQAGNWVFGLEGQGNWADFTGSNLSLAFGNVTNRTKVDALRHGHRPDWLHLEQRPRLREGRRRGDPRQVRRRGHQHRFRVRSRDRNTLGRR